MSGEQAKAYGLIDEVLLPTKKKQLELMETK
jgi:ATP-dependent protease ClpP protease subunit